MKPYAFTLITLLSFLGFIPLNSQTSIQSLQQKFEKISFVEDQLDHNSFFKKKAEEMEISQSSEMKLKNEVLGNNINHYKYQQFYKGIQVIGNTYILHEKDGKVMSANGLYTPALNIDIYPAINKEEAIIKAKVIMTNNILAENNSLYGNLIIQTNDQAELCIIDKSYPENSGYPTLAYEVEVKCEEPHTNERMYIDALDGSLINSFPLIMSHGVPGTAKTRYYGTVDVITDSVGVDNFLMRDPSRGDGINIYTVLFGARTGRILSNNSPFWNLTALNEIHALDALYCSEKFYDMLLEKFNWNGLDNNGSALNVRVNENFKGQSNAYWEDNFINIGQGNCLYGPLTTFEVIGHEFMHGLITHSSHLLYYKESGAINEAFSDITGKALEYYADPERFSWNLAHSFIIDSTASFYRIMDDPKKLKQPAFYKGQYWADDADVHYNSSVCNLWFTLLSDGKIGINEKNYQYDVKAIGVEKAYEIVFLTNKAYCVPITNYNQLVQFTLAATIELFGENSPEYASVSEAWKAVGLPGISDSPLTRDLALTNAFGFFSYACPSQDFIPLKVEISNLSNKDYLPSMNAKLVVSQPTLGEFTMNVDDTIFAGKQKVYNINDWYKFSTNLTENVHFDLQFTDQNQQNNSTAKYFTFLTPVNNNLVLFSAHVIDGPECNGLNEKILVDVANRSCNPMKAGEKFLIKISDDAGTLFLEEHTLLDDLIYPNILDLIVELNTTFSGEKDLIVEIIKAGDPNPADNVKNFKAKKKETIKNDYYDDLSNGPFQLFTHQGAKYMAITGRSEKPENILRCSDPVDLLENEYNNHFSYCVDFSDAKNSYFEFDALLFKSKFSRNTNYPYSVMIQINWEGNESGEAIIFDQPHGLNQHFIYNLPEYFSGYIKIKLYVETGDSHTDITSIANDDVILINNLKITKGRPSSTISATNSDITCSPNPCSDFLYLNNVENFEIEQYSIIDASGKKLLNLRGKRNKIDVSQFIPGMYFLKIIGSNFQSKTIKFSKL